MAERICLMTFYPTECKDNCFNCDCGGAEATEDLVVTIHNVQRVCEIIGNAADTEEGEHIAKTIRNNLERMVECRNKGHLVVYKENGEDGKNLD